MLTDAAASRAYSLAELAALYLRHAEIYYRRRDGTPTREHLNCRAALDRFQTFAGTSATLDRLNRHQVRAWLDQLAAEQLTRDYCNACLSRLRRFARWCVDLDYADPRILTELHGVRALQRFRSAAVEPTPRQPANLDTARAVIAALPQPARDAMQLVMLTGMRIGEVLGLRSADVHTAPPRLILEQHKTAHKGRSRVIPLTPAAFAIIERRLRPLCPLDLLFPAPRAKQIKPYSADALRAAIKRAAKRIDAKSFTPHQVRHAIAALVRDTEGLDAAAALLGHAQISMTEHYAPLTLAHATRGAAAIAPPKSTEARQ